MSLYVVTGRQLMSTTLIIASFVSICVWGAFTFMYYRDLPLVMVNTDGKCVKVVNFKNGDGFSCQDKDVVLRKYRLTAAQ